MKNFLILITILLLAPGFASAGVYNYAVRMMWVGDAEMQLIMRHPENVSEPETAIAAKDCYSGNKSPDWGVQDITSDNPYWASYRDGVTNVQEIVAEDLFDVGNYKIIARCLSNADPEKPYEGTKVFIDTLLWKGVPGDRETVTLNAVYGTQTWPIVKESDYKNLKTRILKFKYVKKGRGKGKYSIHANYGTAIDRDDITTNTYFKVYLNDEQVYRDSGNWEWNKKQTVFHIHKPWTVKVWRNDKKREIKIRGVAEGAYHSVDVASKIVLGRYLGTNTFFVKKSGKYKFKEKDYLNPKK
jgi:hypothetical protein